jgi:enediyne biosynthesis protein E5
MIPLPAPVGPRTPGAAIRSSWADLLVRTAITAALIGCFYPVRGALEAWLVGTLDAATVRVLAITLLLGALLADWWPQVRRDPRFHAPILITAILALSDTSYGILENHAAPPWLVELSGGRLLEYSPTFLTMAITVLTELVVGRFYWGKWPHLASAYISGISVGILMKSSALWPFVLCGMISIVSKYVLRIGDRHLWNPTNFGMTAMLFLAQDHAGSLNVQAGNNGWAVGVIWLLGGLIIFKLGRLHIPLAFVALFVPLAFLRSAVTGHPWQTELAPITSPMFQLYIFFMITDPKTTVRGRWNQVFVAGLVAVAETFFRLAFEDVHSLYHALFVVGPVANLAQIGACRLRARYAARNQTPLTATCEPPPSPAAALATAERHQARVAG